MSSIFNDTLETAKNVINTANEGTQQATDTAKHAYKSAKGGADQAASSVRSTWLDGVKTVSSVVSMLRAFQADDALGWVGLSRRRSPIASFGVFSAGLALGAGAGMLFAPMSGRDLRRTIMKSFSGVTDKAKEVATQVEAQATKVEAKVEDVASKVKDAVVQAEHKAASGVVAIKDAAVNKVDTAVTAAKSSPSENGKIHHPS